MCSISIFIYDRVISFHCVKRKIAASRVRHLVALVCPSLLCEFIISNKRAIISSQSLKHIVFNCSLSQLLSCQVAGFVFLFKKKIPRHQHPESRRSNAASWVWPLVAKDFVSKTLHIRSLFALQRSQISIWNPGSGMNLICFPPIFGPGYYIVLPHVFMSSSTSRYVHHRFE